jgi:predicted transcriptional regulator of viral defense system
VELGWVPVQIAPNSIYFSTVCTNLHPDPVTAMTTPYQKAEQIFRKHNGVLRMSTAIREGIHRRTLYQMLEEGTIERLSRGLYKLSRTLPLEHPDLVTVALRVPESVVCLISALSFHELTTQIPHEVYIAIPFNARCPKIDYPPVRAFRFARTVYSEGIETHRLNRVAVRIYSREKTIVDCFRYRNKIGLDTCLEALRTYKQQRRYNVDAILKYAGICRVTNVMRPYLEALV